MHKWHELPTWYIEVDFSPVFQIRRRWTSRMCACIVIPPSQTSHDPSESNARLADYKCCSSRTKAILWIQVYLKTPRKAQKAASYNKPEYNTIQNELTLCILQHKCRPSMCKWRATLLTRCCRWYHRQEVANNQSRYIVNVTTYREREATADFWVL